MFTINHTNLTNATEPGVIAEHYEHKEPTAIIFIFFGFTVGAAIRTLLKKLPLPYTVILMVLGCAVGIASRYVHGVSRYTTIASLDPHTILNLFLPVLIFESAFNMEIHMFMKSLPQVIILAVPGLLFAAVLTCIFSMYIFDYNWNWAIGMLFGSLISATDPVAVVAVLRDIGASKELATVIEGESLLNDGAAIVFFNVFQMMAIPGNTLGGLSIFIYFLRVVIGGPLLGYVMARLTILWLVNVFNDALTEITITICSTYVTFYVGEMWLGVSGVLAVVVLGVTISASRTSISPEVEVFLHRFWEMLGYLANTLIFILVGVVISEKALQSAQVYDWVMLVALYVTVFLVRLAMFVIFSPLLARIGYGLTWRLMIIMTWSGLRGAVGLALALMLVKHPELDPTEITQNRILLHTAGLVILTLVINATTVSPLLNVLGINEIPMPKRLAMASTIRVIKEVIQESLSHYKTDRFLADANWGMVTRYIAITDPYNKNQSTQEATLTSVGPTCPVCAASALDEKTEKELEEIRREVKLRILNAEKLVDKAIEAKNPKYNVIDPEEIKKSWRVGKIIRLMRRKFYKWQQSRAEEQREVVLKSAVRREMLRICRHPAFDIVMYVVIIVNVAFLIAEFVVDKTICEYDKRHVYDVMFEIVNYIFIAIYIIEAAIKIIALGANYFRQFWNIFDFIIVILSIADMMVTFFLRPEEEMRNVCEDTTNIHDYLNPSMLKIAKVFRLLRLLRSFRLVRGLLPQIINTLDLHINKKIRFGYDVGIGYLRGEEEILFNISLMTTHKSIEREMRLKCATGKLKIMKELGMIQKANPGIAVSVKTQNAARRILNDVSAHILKMKGEGILDEIEAEKLETIIETRMKRLLRVPPSIRPPSPGEIFANQLWIGGTEDRVALIKEHARLQFLQEGSEVEVQTHPRDGLFVITSGLVKLEILAEDFTHIIGQGWRRPVYTKDNPFVGHDAKLPPPNLEQVSDYLTTGSLFGQLSLLTNKRFYVRIKCHTDVQFYYIDHDTIRAAMKQFSRTPSLEYGLWQVAAIRVALPIVSKLHYFKGWNIHLIKKYLEKGIVIMKTWAPWPENDIPEPYALNIDSISLSDTVLVHGYAQDPETGDMFRGPCYVPHRVSVLHMLPVKGERHVLLVISRDLNLQVHDPNIITEGEQPYLGSAYDNPLCPLHRVPTQPEAKPLPAGDETDQELTPSSSGELTPVGV